MKPTHNGEPNYNMQAAGKIGKINLNVLWMIYQVPFNVVEETNFENFKEAMLKHESQELKRKSGTTQCLLCIDPNVE